MNNLFDSTPDFPINILPKDGVTDYYGRIFSDAECEKYYQYLFNQIPWENDEAVIFGKLIITKRKVAWFGEKQFEYTYSNRTKYAKLWTPELLALKQKCEEVSGETYNSCLLNLYHDGNEGMAYHSDGEKDLKNTSGQGASEYYSDPNNPVLSSDNLKDFNGFTPRNYMSEDQRFAVGRPDVLTFTTDVLTEDMTFAGEILAKLNIASSSTDADFAVKLIDVYPEDFKPKEKKDGVIYGNYHQMVRSEIMPARFRNSREQPEALVANQKTSVNFRLQDVVHTFKKGHKIQVQVSSTWFPLFSVNPQKFLDNPNMATIEDYTKAFIKIFEDSLIEVEVLK